MTLDHFLKDNRAEIITRTRAKVASRPSPPAHATELEQGVPLFLSQLSATLESEGAGAKAPSGNGGTTVIGKSAAEHGLTLLKLGFTVEQVVHDYGDICQAVTELAQERDATLTVAEFHTLNRCLDNAIASAVSSWTEAREQTLTGKASDAFTGEIGKLLARATTTLDILRDGKVAVGGATGSLLAATLDDMRALIENHRQG